MRVKSIIICLGLLLSLAFALSAFSAETEKININTATQSELAALPEVGPDLAKAIVEYREINGDFTATDQLLEIEGVDEAKREKLLKVLGIYGIDGTECSC